MATETTDLVDYQETQLRELLERVREGFALLDSERIDVFELDELLRRYHRAVRELRRFCGGSPAERERASRALAYLRDQGEDLDWWRRGSE